MESNVVSVVIAFAWKQRYVVSGGGSPHCRPHLSAQRRWRNVDMIVSNSIGEGHGYTSGPA